MRQRISEKNIFPSFDLFEEYQKLEEIFSYRHTIGTYNMWGDQTELRYTFEQYIQDHQFDNWNLRGTFINLQEMRKKLNIAPESFSKETITEEQLLDYIQFILNCIFRIGTTIFEPESAYFTDRDTLNVLLEQCKLLVDKLHCKEKVDDSSYEIYLIYCNELSAQVSQQNPDIEVSLTDYQRIDNRGDLRRKGEILCTLSKRLESVEAQIKGTEFYQLYNDTTFLLNKIGARHWTGKDKLANATFKKMSPEELEGWYDTAFNLVLSCIAIVPYLAVKDKIKAIRKTEVDK